MKKSAVAVYLTTLLIIGGIVILGANLSLAGTVDLPRTGQTTCYDEDGFVVLCAGTGQDGEIQAGGAWPEPRFTGNFDGTITDNLTGLMWLKDANCFDKMLWQEALDAVADLNANLGGYNCADYPGTYDDWVLPNVNELESLVNAEESNPAGWLSTQGFANVQESEYYQTSTTNVRAPGTAWHVNLYYGYVHGGNKYSPIYVWPVRAASSAPAQLWQTGQTTCYDSSGAVITICDGTGQDGDIQAGVAWPEERFADNGDGTVTDNLTGLMWLKDANCFGEKTWLEALNEVATLNVTPNYPCGNSMANSYNDWHLPNRKELHSLTDYSRDNPALPSGHPFLNVRSDDRYWSSSTSAYHVVGAWIVSMLWGFLGPSDKPGDNYNYVWPVRTGGAGPPENQPPIADSGADQIAFDEVTLDGSGSYDPDGQIVSYAWELKHRENPSYDKTVDGVNPTVSNLEPGYYDVTLTVTDTNDLEDTDSMVVAAAGSCVCVASTMHIESMGATVLKANQGQKFGQVVVKVFDECGRPVPGAGVTGSFTGDYTEQITGLTGIDGTSALTTSIYLKKKPSFTFCVDDVIQETLTYEPADNMESCEILN